MKFEDFYTGLVPRQVKGDTLELRATRQFRNDEEALAVYIEALNRMLDPASWNNIAGELGVEFCQTNARGELLDRKIEEGDYIRIDLPGPGPSAGEGYDWVKVTKIAKQENNSQDEQYAGLQVMTSNEPGSSEIETAHFFEEGASSSFLIVRDRNTVTATYVGRNEIANNTTSRALDNVRNSFVSSAARLGISKIQWGSLLEGLIGDSEIEAEKPGSS